MVKIELTPEEAEVVDNYIFRKAIRLEESNLTDSYCYPKLMSAHRKLQKSLKKSK